MAETAADKASVTELIDTLAVFIKQQQAKVKRIKNMLKKCCKDDNLC